ncbi:MAG: hypothetical protein OEY14_04880, partial [Myxococcales bacterium]|nr:hypothetical protein [Myxococcales bacterium]
KAIAKAPQDRFGSAREFLDAIEGVGRASSEAPEEQEELDRETFEDAAKELRAAPQDEEMAAMIEQLVDPAGAWSEAVAVFEEIAEASEDPDVRRSMLYRVARISASELDELPRAEAAYSKLLESDAEDEVARVGLEELRRQSGAWAELVELLLEKADRTDGNAERASILREIAQISEEKLQDSENAFLAWVQALAESPHEARTIREIERLAGESMDRWNEALSTLSEAVQETEQSSDAVALYVCMGRWYATRLHRPDFAIPCFGQALQLEPANEDAFDGIIELYRRSQSWHELVGILMARAEQSTSAARARDLRADAAEIGLDRLADTETAEGVFEEILAEDPAHPKAAAVMRDIYTGREDWKKLASLLERRSHHQRGEAKVATLLELAEIYEDRFDELETAAVHYEGALAHDERNLSALKGLERLYARASRYEDLLRNLERQLEVVPTPRQKISLLEQIGGIYEEEFVDPEKALGAFEKIVEIDPGHEGANPALARLYRQLRRFDDLVETLDRHARATEDDERGIALLTQGIRVLMAEVGAPERAMSFCDRILKVRPDHSETLELMAQLRAQTGDASAAVEAVDRLAAAEADPSKKAELFLRAAGLLEEAGDRDRAIERLKSALDAEPKHAKAAETLRAIYADRGDASGAADLLRRQLAITEGDAQQARLYAELGFLQRDRLDDTEEAVRSFEQALELDPTCTPAARGLGDVAFEADDFALSVRYYEPLLSRTSELSDEEAKILALRCGDAFRALAEPAKAQRAYLNAKAFAPDERGILERVADVTFEAGEADEAAELYRELLEKHPEIVAGEKGRLLCRQGQALQRAKQWEEAKRVLRSAIELIPESPDPYQALRDLHGDLGEWDQAIAIQKERSEHAGDAERARLLLDLGEIHLREKSDREGALENFHAALEISPDDRNLLSKLMSVYSEGKDWSRLVDVILRIADLVEDSTQLAKYYVTAASIAHEELKRYEDAADYYRQALDNMPTLKPAFEGLVACLDHQEDWRGLAKAYRAQLDRIEESGKPEEKASLWDALGALLREKMGDPAEAIRALEKARSFDPEDRERLATLADIYAGDPQVYADEAIATHADLLQRSPYRAESYQALRSLYTSTKRADEAWCVCQVLHGLKHATADEEAFYRKHRPSHPAAAQEFFTETMWFNHVKHPSLDPLLTGIFGLILPAVSAARAQELSSFEVGEPIDAAHSELVMAQTLHYASGVTQIALPKLYPRSKDPGGLSFLNTNPLAIGLGQGAMAGGPNQALAFVAGRHLSYLLPGHHLRHLVATGTGLRAWLLAAIKSASPQFAVPPKLKGEVKRNTAAIAQHVLGKDRDKLISLVDRLLTAAPELDMKKWVAATDLTADRLGFILANSLSMAMAVIKASPEENLSTNDRIRELTLYAASPSYMELRKRLGIAIGS